MNKHGKWKKLDLKGFFTIRKGGGYESVHFFDGLVNDDLLINWDFLSRSFTGKIGISFVIQGYTK